MRNILTTSVSIFVVFWLLSEIGVAQAFPKYYGDRSMRTYYPNNCLNSADIKKEDWVAFSDDQEAQGQGYKLGVCRKPTSDTTSHYSPAKRLSTVPSLKYVRNNIEKYFGKTVSAIGIMKESSFYYGWFQWRKSDYSSFVLLDDTGRVYLYKRTEKAQYLTDLLSIAQDANLPGVATFEIQQRHFDTSMPEVHFPAYDYSDLVGEMVSFQPSK